MKSNYTPVRRALMANYKLGANVYLSVSTHNVPMVRTTVKRVGQAKVERVQQFDSREEAREYFEERIEKLGDRGYRLAA
jgi:hypothetical protein